MMTLEEGKQSCKWVYAIYRFVNIINGKGYVGSAQNASIRIDQHLKAAAKKSSHFYNALRLRGPDNFRFEILELCNKDNRWKRESFHINRLGLLDPKVGYNKHDPEKRKTNYVGKLGYKLMIFKGAGGTPLYFDSIGELSCYLKVTSKVIEDSINAINRTILVNGWNVLLLKKDKAKRNYSYNKRAKSIIVYNDEYTLQFQSIRLAARCFDVHNWSATKYLKTSKKQHCGFYWRLSTSQDTNIIHWV